MRLNTFKSTQYNKCQIQGGVASQIQQHTLNSHSHVKYRHGWLK